jgi:hypothetical protein
MSANLTRYLPHPQDVAEALGLRRAHSPVLLSGLGLFAAGIVLGSVAALLLTPRSGAELRSDLKDRATALRERLRSPGPDGEDHDSAALA